VGEALALGAALCFGITDFVSTLLARRVHSAAVALVAQPGALPGGAGAAGAHRAPGADQRAQTAGLGLAGAAVGLIAMAG
jgi:hypothetical protein